MSNQHKKKKKKKVLLLFGGSLISAVRFFPTGALIRGGALNRVLRVGAKFIGPHGGLQVGK